MDKRILPIEIHRNRPTCFGSGQDAETGQLAPLAVCRGCLYVGDCSALRIARTLQRDLAEFADVFLSAQFPYGKPADRFGRRRG